MVRVQQLYMFFHIRAGLAQFGQLVVGMGQLGLQPPHGQNSTLPLHQMIGEIADDQHPQNLGENRPVGRIFGGGRQNTHPLILIGETPPVNRINHSENRKF